MPGYHRDSVAREGMRQKARLNTGGAPGISRWKNGFSGGGASP
jgi:hypothetical protein